MKEEIILALTAIPIVAMMIWWWNKSSKSIYVGMHKYENDRNS
jgi:hypothetical protein